MSCTAAQLRARATQVVCTLHEPRHRLGSMACPMQPPRPMQPNSALNTVSHTYTHIRFVILNGNARAHGKAHSRP